MQAEMVLMNGNVVTMDPSYPRGEAVAVRDGRILAVGSNHAISQLIDTGTDVIDLAGRTLLPGLTDNHMHLLNFGISLLQVKLYGARSVVEAMERVRVKAAATAPGKWVLGRGWDQNQYQEGRYPNRYDLDQAAPDHPVAITRICGHLVIANSQALKLAGITRDTPDPEAGIIDRDADGEPTGVLRESSAMSLLRRVIPPYSFAEQQDALLLAMEKAVAAGITSVTTDDVHYAGGLETCLRLYRGAWESGRPAVRTYLLVAAVALDDLLAQGMKTGSGDARVRVGPLKILQDGSFGARTAAMLEPYTDDPGNQGVLIYPQEKLNQLVTRAQGAGMQVAIHAIGDAAVVSCLDAFAAAQAEHPRTDCRHRIIHYSVLSEEVIARTKAMGIIADVQPKFISSDGGWLETRLGPERADLTYPFRRMIDAGILGVGGSDCPVEPFDPLLGIHSAVTRRLDGEPEGSGWRSAERITPQEALQWYTVNGAYSNFEEADKGSIRAGKLADFTILGADPAAVPAETIKDIPVEMTIIGGRIVYAAGVDALIAGVQENMQRKGEADESVAG